jgi:uncharacterized protein (TIGR01777 family)
MKILITGATGLIGKALINRLYLAKHEIVILTRNAQSAATDLIFPCETYAWDAIHEIPKAEAFRGVEAVIHLAGEPIGNERWTAELKKKIFDSRVVGTRNLLKAIEALGEKKPRIFIGASAIGFYGDRGDEVLTEDCVPGNGFLSEVCQAWENQILVAASLSMRTLILRNGVVLAKQGGVLAKLLPLFKTGLGAAIGSGKQWMSWIHIDDLIEIIVSALGNEQFAGKMNVVSPQPVTNSDFTRTFNQALGLPSFLKIPKPIIQLTLGEMSTLVISSQRVLPKKLESLDFRFKFTDLKLALQDICGDSQSKDKTGKALPNKGSILTHKDPRDEEVFYQQFIPQPPEKVFSFFSAAENLEKITPDWLNFKIVNKSTSDIREGTLINYRLKLHGIPLKWKTLIENWDPNHQFVDRQLSGPYQKWVHTHSFEAVPGGTLMTDRVQYRLPGWFLGKLFAGSKVKNDVSAIFKFRKSIIEKAF